MNFAYLNAVVKSEYFPPYDPWFAGGIINYYYFGLVLVAALIKLTGILPEIAFNLAEPMLFGALCAGAFSLAFALSLPAARWLRRVRRRARLSRGLSRRCCSSACSATSTPACRCSTSCGSSAASSRRSPAALARLAAGVLALVQGAHFPGPRLLAQHALHRSRRRRPDPRVPVLHLPVRRPARAPDRAAAHGGRAAGRPEPACAACAPIRGACRGRRW